MTRGKAPSADSAVTDVRAANEDAAPRDTAMEAFLEGNSRRLLGYVRKHFPKELRTLHQPLDVVQDVFLEAFRLGGDCPLHDPAAAHITSS